MSAVRTKQSAGCGVCQDALDHLWVLLPSPRTDLKLQLCPGLPQIPSLFFSGSSLGRGHTGGFLTQTTMATTLHQRSSSSHSPARLAPVGSQAMGGVCSQGQGVLAHGDLHMQGGGCWPGQGCGWQPAGRTCPWTALESCCAPGDCLQGKEAGQPLLRADLDPW